jgi:hypothetical protein
MPEPKKIARAFPSDNIPFNFFTVKVVSIGHTKKNHTGGFKTESRHTVIHQPMLHNHSVIHFNSISPFGDEQNKFYAPNLLQMVTSDTDQLYIKSSGMICTSILVQTLQTLMVHENFWSSQILFEPPRTVNGFPASKLVLFIPGKHV